MYDQETLRLARFLQQGMGRVGAGGHASDVGPPVGPYMHGPNGLFHVYDAEQPLISLQRYGSSLATALPSKGTNRLYPLFGYIMGWGPGGGEDEPATSCDPGPTQGSLYTCWQTAQFGRYKRSTSVIDVAELGVYTGRSEYADFLLLNPNDGAAGGLNLTPTMPGVGGNPAANLNDDFIMRMMGLGIEFERLLGPQLYYGNPANNIGTSGGYAEFPGLDMLVVKGHVDATRPTVTCAGLDSLLYNFNHAQISVNGGQTLVALLTAAMRYMRTLARMTNLDPVDWIMVMRDDLFNAIVDMWPCAYLVNRCDMSGNTQAEGVINLDSIQALRDAMRSGSFIEVDGRRIPVVLDSWIREENSVTDPTHTLTLSQYSSDLYILPRTVRGNIAATYMEYLNWNETSMNAIREAGREQYFATSDGGTYLWTLPPPTETCLFSSATVRTRLIELCPHLCAKLSNLGYAPVIHQPDANPEGSYYMLSGSPDPIDFTVPTSLWNP